MKRLPGAMTMLPFAMLLSWGVSADTFLEASAVDFGDNFRGGNFYAERWVGTGPLINRGDSGVQRNLIISYEF